MIREAASIILLRRQEPAEAKTNDPSFEVFLLRRHRGASFMASAYVFPGGAAEEGEDARTAGARELFEEAGVLLAKQKLDRDSDTLEVTGPDAIRARIGTRAGDPYRSVQVAKDVREIQALGFFRDVRVFVDATPKGRVVTFEVEENPVVRQISITGNESVDSDKIKDILTLTTGSTLDLPLLFENRSRIEGLYRAEGFYLAEVGYEVEPLG